MSDLEESKYQQAELRYQLNHFTYIEIFYY